MLVAGKDGAVLVKPGGQDEDWDAIELVVDKQGIPRLPVSETKQAAAFEVRRAVEAYSGRRGRPGKPGFTPREHPGPWAPAWAGWRAISVIGLVGAPYLNGGAVLGGSPPRSSPRIPDSPNFEISQTRKSVLFS